MLILAVSMRLALALTLVLISLTCIYRTPPCIYWPSLALALTLALIILTQVQPLNPILARIRVRFRVI